MNPIYKDPSYSPAERTADLVGRMTLDEKLMQMRLLCQPSSFFPDYVFDEEHLLPVLERCGALYCTDSPPPAFINALQDYLLHKTRLGIPAAVHSESLHGALRKEGTIFPQALGLGATWNPALMSEIVDVIGAETRASGVTQTYAPNLDLSRDPRWGRVEENYGEDPYLTSRLGVAYIKALQSHGVASSPKHYIAHGSPESGVNIAPVHAGERELRETLMVPFQKAFMEAGALSVMPAYSELDGVPVHASHFLLTDLLRGEFGFTGHAVSDFGAISMLTHNHHVAPDAKTAGIMALKAGIDVEAPNMFGFGEDLKKAVEAGEVPMELIDRAVSRVLLVKFKLGLFENPYAEEKPAYRTPHALEMTRKAAEESAVLLKNDGRLLPLSANVGKVAVIGPNAGYTQLGDYILHEAAVRGVTVKQALEERLGAENVLYAKGSFIAFEDEAMLAQAVDAAKQADVAVVVLGDNSSYYRDFWGDEGTGRRPVITCGEGFDVTDLNLPDAQEKLLEAVWATGTPVVLVMMSGRPHSIVWARDHIPAILEAWYPGEQGGYAIANLLFGDVNPSGKLPITIPQSVGHIPCYYNRKASAFNIYHQPGSPEAPGRDYVFSSPDPLFPFGFGLSYTDFSYANLTVTPDGKPLPDAAVTVSVDVTNTGDRAGKETVQLFLTDSYCRITPFVKRLRGFSKVALAPKETKTVTFTLGFEDFAFINEQMKPEAEAGEFVVRIGSLSAAFCLS